MLTVADHTDYRELKALQACGFYFLLQINGKTEYGQ